MGHLSSSSLGLGWEGEMETTKLSSSPPRGSVHEEDGAEVGSSSQKAHTVGFLSPWAA